MRGFFSKFESFLKDPVYSALNSNIIVGALSFSLFAGARDAEIARLENEVKAEQVKLLQLVAIAKTLEASGKNLADKLDKTEQTLSQYKKLNSQHPVQNAALISFITQSIGHIYKFANTPVGSVVIGGYLAEFYRDQDYKRLMEQAESLHTKCRALESTIRSEQNNFNTTLSDLLDVSIALQDQKVEYRHNNDRYLNQSAAPYSVSQIFKQASQQIAINKAAGRDGQALGKELR
jgi:hypothetical protein